MPDFDVNFTGSNGDLDQLLPGGQVNSSHVMEKIVSSNVLLRFSQDKATTNRHAGVLGRDIEIFSHIFPKNPIAILK